MAPKTSLARLLGSITLGILLTPSAFALDQIIRPYQSVRSAGMGGVRITTGLYDENFFGNPARVTANPKTRFTLISLTPVELNPSTISTGTSLYTGANPLTTIVNSAGSNFHERTQMVLPAFYLNAQGDRKLAFALGFIASFQTDSIIRQSYQLNLMGIADIGPAVTVGYKFLKNDALSVGFTGHAIYRAETNPSYSLLSYVEGVPLSASQVIGEGSMVDFDIGGTYDILEFSGIKFSAGAAMQNLLGGNYSNLPIKFFNLATKPPAQPRTLGLGVSLAHASYWGPLRDTLLAFEATDIGNNSNDSFFKLLHIGAETRLSVMALRVGINQGYLTAGVGFDLRFFTLDLATYGEEMSLNTGGFEDRRYTLNLGFHI